MPALTTATNALIKRLAALDVAQGRREQNLFLVEGRRAIADCLDAGWRPAHLLVREDLEPPAGWTGILAVGARVITRLSQASSASGYLAAFALPTVPPLVAHQGGLILAGIADPGNAGTLVRTAAALGITQLMVLGGADPYAAKAVQASAGAIARVALHRLSEVPEGVERDAPLCALVPRGGAPPEQLARQARWLVIGGEAHGIPPGLQSRCTEQVSLPMPGGTDSLNAAIAGAIAAYLLLREPT